MRRVQNDYHFALVFFSVGISFTKAYIQLVKRGKRYHYEDGKRHHGVLKAPYEDMINAAVGVSFGIISLLAAVGIGYELSKSYELDANPVRACR